ncbi:nitroreductase family protein [Peribacillus butanolivorans]|uniref:nitroreductase family protein n=1 Tax=Peribacillus butanolivorans TaxID=421767 RepID=UPI0036716B55
MKTNNRTYIDKRSRMNMKLEQIIKERRSIKRFKDIPVPLDTIQSLLETSTWAPNHKMTQPWRFIVVQGGSRLKLAEAPVLLWQARKRIRKRKKKLDSADIIN